MALHTALMLHELGTNSNKYGALSAAKGQVTISWTVDDGLLRLRWVERGGPPVEAPTTRGFGTTLIEQSAKSEGGNARMSVEADGIIWEIDLPLRPATASIGAQPNPPATPLASTSPRPQARAVQNAPPRLAGKRFLWSRMSRSLRSI